LADRVKKEVEMNVTRGRTLKQDILTEIDGELSEKATVMSSPRREQLILK
jgi:hypothetical protein